MYGYPESMLKLKEFIEHLANEPNPLGYYLKAFGLKYGLLGFEQNVPEANALIRDLGIPF